eukprot:TRINITY_DN69128_c0_g1_i1.p1 TRINITY_DN69128_c0_g1~~TRINITY_DN69128_c0_g1_i1.p1  ORF type:complete len:345 (-),score=40.98 TRINITY_DN69128_c0_g1_i1:57-1016(-)
MAAAVTSSVQRVTVGTHHIWGKIDSDSSCSASIDQSCENYDVDWPQPRQRRSRSLPADMQQHLAHVVFHDESRSSAEIHSSTDDSAEARVPGGFCATPSVQVGEPPTVPVTAVVGPDVDVDADQPAESKMASVDGEPWSKGSELHESGKCKPCHYIHTKLGCLNGQECKFCHISHSKKSRPRPCKTKRMQCKRIVSMLETASAKDPEQFADATRMLASQSTYLQSVLKNQLGGGVNKGDDLQASHPTPLPVVAPLRKGRADVLDANGGDCGILTQSTSAPSEASSLRSGGSPATVSALLNKLKGALSVAPSGNSSNQTT